MKTSKTFYILLILLISNALVAMQQSQKQDNKQADDKRTHYGANSTRTDVDGYCPGNKASNYCDTEAPISPRPKSPSTDAPLTFYCPGGH